MNEPTDAMKRGTEMHEALDPRHEVIQRYEVPMAAVIANGKMAMPKGATILHAAAQDGTPYIWVSANTTAPLVGRKIQVASTGHVSPAGHYVGACFCGPLVWHVFDLGEA